ncbi:MAG: hypothetical protein KKH52_00965 [Nanoarchaeota archaeon]|nr:hypothetical protein [Nanoarchaeota archaeon]MBU1622934.1 hypothetical protein [Nanoarchaeota archaeon]MBU1973947.1 hypothetical protein [Nanoarchaeota archaeon]
MSNLFLPILLATIISIAYYYSNKWTIKHAEWNKKIFSFSAGVSITYVLLELFPTFTEAALSIHKILFISIPVGFIIHHIIEKEIYMHNIKRDLVRMLTLEEHVFSFIYHFIIGIILVTFAKGSAAEAVLFSIPMLSYTFLSNLPASRHPLKIKALFLSTATVLGTVFALLWRNMPAKIEYSLIGIAIGVLLYTIIRHHIPFGNKGHIGYFTIGFVIYSALIILSWYI